MSKLIEGLFHNVTQAVFSLVNVALFYYYLKVAIYDAGQVAIIFIYCVVSDFQGTCVWVLAFFY